MISIIDEPNRMACMKLYQDNVDLFNTMQGSTHNHQAWKGGYNDHICEVMNICILLYPIYQMRKQDFLLQDALLVCFLHDLEKPWKSKSTDKLSGRLLRALKINEYGITLTEQHLNAIEYVEGERENYSRDKRTMNELAAFCHIADVWSARIWHNYPKQENE